MLSLLNFYVYCSTIHFQMHLIACNAVFIQNDLLSLIPYQYGHNEANYHMLIEKKLLKCQLTEEIRF